RSSATRDSDSRALSASSRAEARLQAKRRRGRSPLRYMKSASPLPVRHRSDQSRARGLRAARTHRRRRETKTQYRLAAGKNRYQGDKIADQPAPPRSQGNPAFLLWRDATECRNEIYNRKRARRRRRARRLHLRSKVSPAATPLRNRVVPSIWRKTVVLQSVPCGGNCWG